MSSISIIRNSIVLYFRTVVVLLISLFSSRLILNELGVEDYGIYIVITGFVALFNALSGGFSAAIGRFIAFELGRKNYLKIKVIFSAALLIQIIIAMIAFIIFETIGLWAVENILTIPQLRIDSAKFVLHITSIIFSINLVIIPYRSMIIANEDMNIYSMITIVESILKISAIGMLFYANEDKLKVYILLLLAVAICNFMIHFIICLKKYRTATINRMPSKKVFFDIFSFSSWNMIGNCATLLNLQGTNVLINIFFGVGLNAARGIAAQVESAIMQFVNTVVIALSPQITKGYSTSNFLYMLKLTYRGSKYAYLMTLFFAIPIIQETDYILSLWLVKPPEYAALFVKLTVVVTLIEVLSKTLISAMLATGKIRNYQIIVGGVFSFIFFLSGLSFYFGCSIEWTYYISIAISCICLLLRLIMLKPLINISILDFFMETVVRVLPVTIIAYFTTYIVIYLFQPSFLRLMLSCFVNWIVIIAVGYNIALAKEEKEFIKSKALGIFKITK